MEMVEVEEKPWKVVNRRMKKNPQLLRPWDALPSLALSNIFINLDLKDRCCSIPFVCKAWNSVISGDPLCWSSMIPESVSPDDAFIKNPADYYSSLQIQSLSSYSRFYSYRHGREDYYPLLIRGGKWDGVSRFRTLLRKSSLSSSSSAAAAAANNNNNYSSSSISTITSLHLAPFTYSYPDNEESLDQNEILHLIANCCPKLKHISLDGFCYASREAVFEVFHRCKKLELVDFSDSLKYIDDADSFIEELGNNLPHLRGIRILGGWGHHTSIVNVIATHLPRIKLLDIECNAVEVSRLLSLYEMSELPQLQYLRVGVYSFTAQLQPPVCTHIPEFHYEDIDYLMFTFPDFCQCRPRHRQPGSSSSPFCTFCTYEEKDAKKKEEEEDILSEYYYYSCHPDQDYSILKQKKEDEYYVSILKENKKKRRNHHHEYALMRTRRLMKKKNNKAASSSSSILKIMKMKRDNKYDYYLDDYHYIDPTQKKC